MIAAKVTSTTFGQAVDENGHDYDYALYGVQFICPNCHCETEQVIPDPAPATLECTSCHVPLRLTGSYPDGFYLSQILVSSGEKRVGSANLKKHWRSIIACAVSLIIGYWLGSSRGEWKSAVGGRLMFHSRTGEVRVTATGKTVDQLPP